MSQKLPPNDKELYQRCDEVLHYIWDPIGVAGAPGARDEYCSYLPQAFRLVKEGFSVDEIVAYLNEIVEERIGIQPDSECSRRAAKIMLEWRDWIDRKD